MSDQSPAISRPDQIPARGANNGGARSGRRWISDGIIGLRNKTRHYHYSRTRACLQVCHRGCLILKLCDLHFKSPAEAEGEGHGERLQGAAVGPGQEPQHLGHGGGGRGGGQHQAAQYL